jgi:RHS repeat-associated protein
MFNSVFQLIRNLTITGCFLFASASAALAYDEGPPTPPGTAAGNGSNSNAGNPNQGSNPNSNKNGQGNGGEPVDLYSGQFQLESTDVNIPGRMPLRVKRFYRSGSAYQGMLGHGWNIEYNERILILATNGNLLLRRNNTALDEFANRGNGTFAPHAGCYDALSRNGDGTYTLRERHGTIRNYNTDGCLTEVRDRNWNQLLLTFQAGGKLPINTVSPYSHYTNAILVARDYQLVRIEVAWSNVLSGRFIQFSYDSYGRATNVTDFTGRTWRYNYDSQGRGLLQSVTTPPVADFTNGLTTLYSYASSSSFRLATITDSVGQTYLTNLYNSAGRVVAQYFGGASFGFYYPTATSCFLTNPNSYVVERSFDTSGNVLMRKEYTAGIRPSDPPYYLTSYTYNTNNEQTKVVYPAGNVEQRKYDALGNLLELRRKAADTNDSVADITYTYTYEPRFNPLKTAADPRGNVTTYVNDYEVPSSGQTNGNLVQITYPAVAGTSPVVSYSSDVFGQRSTITNASGTVTSLLRDDATGFVLQRIEAFGTAIAATNAFAYDDRGNALTTTDARGNISGRQYDALDRVVYVTNSLSCACSVQHYLYTANGKLARVERQTGDASHPWQATTFSYDALDRLTSVTNDVGQVTQYSHDPAGNLTVVTDANGNATVYTYDERNLLWKTIDAMTNTTRYTYNLNGQPMQFADARSNITVYAYDSFDRLATRTYPDSSAETRIWDAAGNLAAEGLRAGTWITNSYDVLNRRVLRTYSDSSAVQYKYDLRGLLLSATNSNGVLTFEYDARGRLVNSTNGFGMRVAYEYDPMGSLAKLTYPDGSFVTYAYDSLNRLTRVLDGGTNLVGTFTYDSLGRRTQLTYGNGTQVAYSYDWANNITNITHTITNAGTMLGRFGYAYDNAGNRLSMTTEAVSYPGTHVYGYDKTYQLTSAAYPAGYPFLGMSFTYDRAGNRAKTVDGGTVNYIANNLNEYTSVGAVAYSYSANGNLVTDGSSIFSYDDDNRLIWAAKVGTSATYTFDGLGRRFEKNVNGTILRFVYAGNRIIADCDLSGSVIRKFVFGSRIDEPMCMLTSGSPLFYHSDAQGSVCFLSGPGAAKPHLYTYDAFGRLATSSTNAGNRFTYAARESDFESGVMHYRMRSYMPGLGRFMQPDPVREQGGPNLFAYVGNNPVRFVDPLGLAACNGQGPDFSNPTTSPNTTTGPFTPPDTSVHSPIVTPPGPYTPPGSGTDSPTAPPDVYTDPNSGAHPTTGPWPQPP